MVRNCKFFIHNFFQKTFSEWKLYMTNIVCEIWKVVGIKDLTMHCRIFVNLSVLCYNIRPWFDDCLKLDRSYHKMRISAESLHFDEFFWPRSWAVLQTAFFFFQCSHFVFLIGIFLYFWISYLIYEFLYDAIIMMQ